ncbi:MAG: hypothetical protein V4494_01750 [Chlamydiota bacterium]
MSKDRCAIGKAGDGKITYAVYPDYTTGHEALVVMLKGSIYSPLILRAALTRHNKGNSNDINQIVTITGFDPERRIKSLNEKEFERRPRREGGYRRPRGCKALVIFSATNF